METSFRGAGRRLVAGGATAALAVAGLSLGLAAPAHAAVTVSGSTIDAAGNYVDGYISVFKGFDEDGDGTVEPFEYDFVDGTSTQGGAFDLNLDDGNYKLSFFPQSGSSELQFEYYRDKADFGTADLVTVAGLAQTLPAWTIDARPVITGVVTTSDGRPVRDANVAAYAADGSGFLAQDVTDSTGAFVVGVDEAAKLVFSDGYDSITQKSLATEWYSDKADFDTADVVIPGASVGTIALAPGGSISGTITNEAGAPLHRAQACADSNCDYADANGVYTIEGVSTGAHDVEFSDPLGEYLGEYFDNVALDEDGDPVSEPSVVNVGPGQAFAGVNAALAAASNPALTGVDISGVVTDQLGGVGVGYPVYAWNTPADPRDREVVASTISNRSGGYAFTTLDRVGGETEFKIVVASEEVAREDGEFARRSIWTGQKYGYETATPVSAAPQVINFVQPVAGGVSGAVTSEAGGVPENPYVLFNDVDNRSVYSDNEFQADGTYETRNLWPGDYTALLGASLHVPEWWDDAVAAEAKTITVRPGEMVTGISAVLAKDVKAVERPTIEGDAWVNKTLTLDKGVWTAMGDTQFTYEWLVGSTVIATGPSLKLTKKNLGDKITGRVTNDAGFTQGQAVTASTFKVGYKPKVRAKVSAKSAAITLKVKPLKAKKVKATIKVYEIVGVKKNGDDKLKKLGKVKIKKGKGVVRFKKTLSKGKHTLVFSVRGKGKVGSGDIEKKIKIKR